MSVRDGDQIYFYELHEGDDELFTDVLLVHDAEYDEAEFLELVVEARARVLEHFDQDTLVEAVAADLARNHGFLVVDDRQLRVAVNVSAQEGETRLADVEATGRGASDEDEGDSEFRSLLVELDQEDARWRN
jgi:hypothetical protein